MNNNRQGKCVVCAASGEPLSLLGKMLEICSSLDFNLCAFFLHLFILHYNVVILCSHGDSDLVLSLCPGQP